MKKSLILLVIVLALSSVSATTYYVSSSLGDDSYDGLAPQWNGTSGPIKTLAKAGEISNRATGKMVGGDELLFKRGDYWKENASSSIIKLSHKGTKNLPTIIGAYGIGNHPVFDIEFSSGGGIIDITSSNLAKRTEWLIIRDLELTSTASNSSRPSGIRLFESKEDEYPRNVVFKNLIFKNLRQALNIQGTINFTLRDSLLDHNYKRPPLTGYSSGFYTKNIDYIYIINNTFNVNGKQHDSGDHQNYISHCHHVFIENNTYLNSNSGVKLRTGSDYVYRGNTCLRHSQCIMGGTDNMEINSENNFSNFLVENNIFDKSGIAIALIAQSGGLSKLHNTTIRNNLFLNQRDAPGERGYIKVAANSEHHKTYIYNNLFYNFTGDHAIYLNYAASRNLHKYDFHIKNNIFYYINNGNNAARIFSYDPPSRIGTEIFFDNNIHYNQNRKIIFEIDGKDYYNLTELRKDYPNISLNSLEGNPNLMNVSSSLFYLTNESTLAIDSGATLSLVSRDFLGTTRPYGSGYDIGPYEYVPGGSSICGDSFIQVGEVCDSNVRPCTINGDLGIQDCNSNCNGWENCIVTIVTPPTNNETNQTNNNSQQQNQSQGSSGGSSGSSGGSSQSTLTTPVTPTTDLITRKQKFFLKGKTYKFETNNRFIKQINLIMAKDADQGSIELFEKGFLSIPVMKGKVLQAFEIKPIQGLSESGSISSGELTFKVPKSWIEENYIDKVDGVKLARLNENWEYFDANLISEESEGITYEAKVPGFSEFAIIGLTKQELIIESRNQKVISLAGLSIALIIVGSGIAIIIIFLQVDQIRKRKRKAFEQMKKSQELVRTYVGKIGE